MDKCTTDAFSYCINALLLKYAVYLGYLLRKMALSIAFTVREPGAFSVDLYYRQDFKTFLQML